MIWDNIKTGIRFEDSGVHFQWNIEMDTLVTYGQPKFEENGGRVHITWSSVTLLEGIRGDWAVSYFPNEGKSSFKKISLSFSGDEASISAFDKFKQHLTEKLGTPSLEIEDLSGIEAKWEFGNIYIRLYLFEMHAYRCTLTVGIQ